MKITVFSFQFSVFKFEERGFSLVEVLAALAIFGIAIVALIQGIGMALGLWRLAEEKSKALMLAENVMEEIIYNGDLSPREESGEYDPPNDRFRWESSIEQTEIEGLSRITVRILWPWRSQERDVTLTTLKAERAKAQLQYAGGV